MSYVHTTTQRLKRFVVTVVLIPLLIQVTLGLNFSCIIAPTPFPGASPSLPNISNQFTTQVEANIENKGYTVNAVEYFDEPNNRGRLDFSGAYQQGRFSLIYTYSDEQWLYINSTHCTAHPLLPNSTFLAFPVNFENQGNAHIRGVADILLFGKKYNETYLGQETVRGISADHWKTCMDTRFGGSMSVDWYFTAADWTSEGNGTPLRLVVEGVDPNRAQPNTYNNTDGWHYFKHSYDFVFFTEGPPDNSVFQIPRGMFCDGSNARKDMPSIPEHFSARLQMVNAVNNTIYNLAEVHDPKTQQFVFRAPLLTVVQDFRLGVGFFLSADNCTTFPLSVALLYLSSGEKTIARLSEDKKHLQMKSAKLLFGLSSKYNSSYIGTRMVNDIPCDVFVEERNDYPHPGNVTVIELSFARRSLNYLTSSGHTVQQVPIRYEQYSKSLLGRLLDPPLATDYHQIFNIYEFSTSTQNVEQVELERCYTSSTTVWFQVDAQFDSLVGLDSKVFSSCTKDAVAQAAQVDMSRVTRVTPIRFGEGILIQVTLLGSLNKANLTTYISTGVSLDEAVTNMEQAVNEEQLAVVVNQTGTQYFAMRNSFTTTNPAFVCMNGSTTFPPTVRQSTVPSTPSSVVLTSDTASTCPTDCPNTSDSSGCEAALAALGLAMFIMGFAVACIVFCWLIHRRKQYDDFDEWQQLH